MARLMAKPDAAFLKQVIIPTAIDSFIDMDTFPNHPLDNGQMGCDQILLFFCQTDILFSHVSPPLRCQNLAGLQGFPAKGCYLVAHLFGKHTDMYLVRIFDTYS